MKRTALLVFVLAVASVCSGQWLERQLVIGDTLGGVNYPSGVVVNPISGNVYIEAEPIQIFNPATMTKLSGPGATGPVVFCPPSGKGYVVGDSLVILGAVKDRVIGSATLPIEPDLYAYSRTSNRLYLASTYNNDLMVFDPDGDSILKTIDVGFGISALLWDSVWNRLYVGHCLDSATAKLGVLDCAGDTLLPGIQTGLRSVLPFALSTVSHQLYCRGRDTAWVSRYIVVSADSLKVVDTLPALPGLDDIVYSPMTDRLYVARDGDQEVCIVDCRSDSIRSLCDVGQNISVIAASNLTGKVYLGNHDSPQVMVMDTFDSVVGSISPPSNASDHEIDALAFSRGRNELYGVTDGNKAFIVDASVDTVAGSVNYVPVAATQMIHNLAGNKLYALCPGIADVLVFDSTFGTPRHIHGGVFSTYAFPVLNPALNRIYVADDNYLRVIDCNSDSLVENKSTAGIRLAVPVMIPYLNKMYVFPGGGSDGDTVFAYDALKGTVSSVLTLSNGVTCAVYDQRSNHVFFACQSPPTILVLDPTTNSVIKTFGLGGGSQQGTMALDPDLGRLYYTDVWPNRMCTIDVLADSVIASESLPWSIEATILNRRLGKLFMCSMDTAKVLVFDCGKGTVVDTINAGYGYAGLMDDRNDKLYLKNGAVVDCRYDSVVALLPPGSQDPGSMAWDAMDNRVFEAPTSRIYVYRDEPYGVADSRVSPREQRFATIVREVLVLPGAGTVKPGARNVLLDVGGRKVLDLSPGRNDVRALPAGVYFVRQDVGGRTTKIVIQR